MAKKPEENASTAQEVVPKEVAPKEVVPNRIEKEDALAVLRTETALSRFPMHRLTKGKMVQIEIKNQASAVYWKLSHNSDYGQPGALAYKLDSLFINRRIEEAGRPTPKIIRLGSLREVAMEMGLGTNTNAVKEALLQNATASITAKISYRTQDGAEQWLEAVFNRYSVVFTGEKFPQGGTADAVYLVLNDIYQQILSTAIYRPLDYDYMKSLPPIAQRFYEIVSYQIYAAVRHDNPRAKLLYSEYCLLSTATRYLDFDHVKKQMYKVLRPHTQSGYIAKVEYESLTNEQGENDWWMYYTPGPNAGREYHAFTGVGKIRKPGKTRKPTKTPKPNKTKKKTESSDLALPFPNEAPLSAPDEIESQLIAQTSPETALIEQLVAAELNRGDAQRFAREKPAECRRQLEFLPHVREFKTSRGAYLRRAIEEEYGPPKGYAQEQTRQASLETTRRQRGAAALQAAEIVARQSHEKRCSEPYLNYLRERVKEAQKTQPEAFQSFEQGEAAQRATLTSGPFAGRPLQQKALEVFDAEAMRLERARDFFHARGFTILNFWEWDAAQNPKPFQF